MPCHARGQSQPCDNQMLDRPPRLESTDAANRPCMSIRVTAFASRPLVYVAAEPCQPARQSRERVADHVTATRSGRSAPVCVTTKCCMSPTTSLCQPARAVERQKPILCTHTPLTQESPPSVPPFHLAYGHIFLTDALNRRIYQQNGNYQVRFV